MLARVLISFFSVLIVFIISFITFSWSSNINLNEYFKDNFSQTWILNLYKDWDNLTFYWDENSIKSDYKYEKINYFDKFFFQKQDSYEKKWNWDDFELSLKKWKFFVYFTLPKSYTISWNWYKINFNWPIKLYIDTENDNKLNLLSLNNSINIKLYWLKDKKEKTDIYVFPHMYYSIDLSLNENIANADYLRIIQLNAIKYIDDKLYKIEEKSNDFRLNEKFFSDIIKFFKSEEEYYKKDNIVLNNNYDETKYDYLSKNFWLLVNNSKKSLYYKDLIYMSLLKIYNSDKITDIEIDKTKKYFLKLKEIDLKWFEETKVLLSYFNSMILLDKKINQIDKKTKFNLLLSDILWFKNVNSNDLLYFLYDLYDFWEEKLFFDWIINFSNIYLMENWLEIKNDKLLWYDYVKNFKMWYYIWFLENIIKTNLQSGNNEKIKEIISLFYKYSRLSVSVYSNLEDKRKTMIILHINFLKEFSDFIRKAFFENNLENDYLLILKNSLNYSSDDIYYLEKWYSNIYNFFNVNKIIFDSNQERDKIYLDEYARINWNMQDYISAIKNYNKYKLDKSWIYNDILLEKETNVSTWKIYTTSEIEKYFSKFNWVSKTGFFVETLDNKKYIITMIISWKKFEFEFFPEENFLIKWITIDWEKLKLNYSLNLIEERYKSKEKSGWSNQNETYLNFFIDTFFKTDDKEEKPKNNYEDYNANDNKWKDTLEEMMFKRDVLLARNWEFSSLTGFTNISSENVSVKFEAWKRNIKLDWVKILLASSKNDGKYYWAFMDSDFIISWYDRYFENIKLKIFKQDWESSLEDFWLWDIKIDMAWKVNLNNFKTFFQDFFSNYDRIVYVWIALYKEFWPIEIIVNSWRLINFKFEYKSRKFDIIMIWNKIINIKQNWNSKIDSQFIYTSLEKYINLLIK